MKAPTIPTFRIDPEIERVQQARVAAVRAARDAGGWRASLDAIRDAARGDTNLVPPVIAAVQCERHGRRNLGYATGASSASIANLPLNR